MGEKHAVDGVDGVDAAGGAGEVRTRRSPEAALSRRKLGFLAGAGLASLALPGSAHAEAPAPTGLTAGFVSSAGPAGSPRSSDSARPTDSARSSDSAGSDDPAPTALRAAFLGTYTTQPGGGTGIGLATYRPGRGELASTGVLPGIANPSYLALSPDRRTLYAVNEQTEGAVTAVRVGPGRPTELLGSRPAGGADPCHLSVHGRFLLSAHYTSGSVSVHPLGRDGAPGAVSDVVRHEGSGPDPERQEGPHAHQVVTDPAGRYVLAVDLGTDTVHTYRLDGRKGTLREMSRASLRPGAGPRHLVFHPSGRYVYLVNELDSTLVVCAYEPRTGTLTPGKRQPTLPRGTVLNERNYPAGVIISADGRFVYVSNRGHDSIAAFAVRRGGAELRPLSLTPSGGSYPRHIVLDPTGRLLFASNQKSGKVTTFRVDRETGRLSSAGAALESPVPVCVLPL
ncbi:beta-propeller fold lactonase family protein [Streptomyces sp. NPDC088745]|uniref:beta-propeller fold lactonase family protein n=1 Tax=Streptomyces sp. NPDC088745 TaxID=3365884 RepID=UPI0038308AAA